MRRDAPRPIDMKVVGFGRTTRAFADRPDWARRIVEARIAAGLTQRALAALVDCNPVTVGDVERGAYAPLPLRRRIEKVLRIEDES